MSKQIESVNDIFNKLNETKVLDELVLIGSWCQYVYKHSDEFNYIMQESSTITTMDMDFMIPDKNKVKRKIDVPEVLRELGFSEDRKINGLIKYERPDLELEFITPAKGKRTDDVVKIEKLNITATPLNFMNVLSDYTIKVKYNDLKIKVPEPEIFTLIKFLVSERRTSKAKTEKDMNTAIEYYNILMSDEKHRKRLKKVYSGLIPSWRKKLKNIFQKNELDIREIE